MASLPLPDGTFLLEEADRPFGESRIWLRMLPDGALDPRFTMNAAFSGEEGVITLLMQAGLPDGGVIGQAEFKRGMLGSTGRMLVRLGPDGVMDPSFRADFTEAELRNFNAIAVLPDGRILLGGISSATNAPLLIRLETDGRRDASFPPLPSLPKFWSVTGLGLQADGKILVGGLGSSDLAGIPAIIRLHPDGTRDMSFAPLFGEVTASDTMIYTTVFVQHLIEQPDGKVLAGGRMGRVNNRPCSCLIRLMPNGATDTTFQAQVIHEVDQLHLQADGKILVGSDFNRPSLLIPPPPEPRLMLARLHPNGARDTSFNAPLSAAGRKVLGLSLAEDGSVQVCGSWHSAVQQNFGGFAQLENDPAISQVETLSGPPVLRWRRGGSALEVGWTRFEARVAGAADWTVLGDGVRTAAGWELAGAALPAQGEVRVRGYVMHAPWNVVEQRLALGGAAPVLAVEPSVGGVVDCGAGWPGAVSDRSFTLRNTGNATLQRLHAEITGTHAADYQLVLAPDYPLEPVPHGETTSFTVRFTPGAMGPRSATLRLSGPGLPAPFEITLSGQGSAALSPVFASQEDVPFTTASFSPSGWSLGSVTLLFPPEIGSPLTVAKHTGAEGFQGVLDDVPEKGIVTATYQGQTHVFWAEYERASMGGLKLHWMGPGAADRDFDADLYLNPLSSSPSIAAMAGQPDGCVLVSTVASLVSTQSGLLRLYPNGRLDPLFAPTLNAFGGQILALAVQTDRSILAAGTFTDIAGKSKARLARLRPDGTLDETFAPLIPNGKISCLLVQPDGKIVIGGTFTSVNGVPQARLARLLPDGSLDPSLGRLFAHESRQAEVLCLGWRPDGKLFAGGYFTHIDGVECRALAVFNSDGSRDPGFNANALFPDGGGVRCLSPLPDRRLLIAGDAYSGACVRLLPGGSLDESFAISTNGSVTVLVLQADGKIVIGGSFSSVDGISRDNLARLLPDGSTVDPGFMPRPGAPISSLVLQADGKLLLPYGSFQRYRGMARLLQDGSLDPAFISHTSSLSPPSALMLQGDGRLLASGDFLSIHRVSRRYLARLLNDPATETLSVPDAGTVRWMRGGSAPETHDVWFDVSADAGLTWTRLGTGSRITGGWELGGLNLPASGQVRARARVVGGYHNASSSLVESVAVFAHETTALEQWRATHFGSPLNQGAGRDDADADFDGLPNLMEYALGFSPHVGNAAHAPRWTANGGFWELRVTPSPAASGVVCSAEWSPNLQPGSWQPAEDAGSAGAGHLFRVLAPSSSGPSARYVRWRVRQSTQP